MVKKSSGGKDLQNHYNERFKKKLIQFIKRREIFFCDLKNKLLCDLYDNSFTS
jgi:hypothetical protein